MSRRLPYLALALLFVWAAAVEIRAGMDIIGGVLDRENSTRAPFQIAAYSDQVASVRPEAASAGLLERDRILAVQGVPYTGEAVLARALAPLKPGQVLVVEVAPDEGSPARKTVSIALPGFPPATWMAGIVAVMAGVVTPVTCLLLGFFVAFLRPRDPLAWILLGMMAGFACLTGSGVGAWPAGLRQAAIVFHDGGVVMWAVFMLLFGIYFPERSELDRRRPWLKWTLIAPLIAFAVLGTADSLGQSENFREFLPLHRVLTPFGKLQALIMMVSISLFFFLLGIKSRTTQSPDARRRLRLLIVGGEVGMTPMAIVFLAKVFFSSALETPLLSWLVIPAFIFLFAFPATLAYVIVVHRALDVRVAVRQGIQYALVRGGVRGIQAALIIVAATLAARGEGNVLQRFVFIGFAIIAVVRLRQVADKLRLWVDRRFFREAVDTEKVLAELSEKVRGIVETGPLLEVVARRLSDSLHVPRVAVLIGGAGGYCPAFSLGFGGAMLPCVPEQGAVVRKLTEGSAARVYFDDPESWVAKSPEAGEPLRALDSQLLLPLLVKDRLPGIISLGPKQSEEPYSASDVHLLESVASQVGLALENSRLTLAVASEVAQRERLNREIEIAREVQERLFPQNSPPVPGFDYFGHCRPALGVGGDYYDFVPQEDGSLGIAIGDVSGKGIAAALLMASLQASLRGQTLRSPGEPGADLATIMRHVNRLVYDASSSNRYATFFYARYNPASRELSYVNAGHNPPVVLRGGEEAIRLEAGGAVVGLLSGSQYREGMVQLQPGDTFVAFTDGISESMDPDDEEWGEDAMIQAARQLSGLTAREMVDRLVAAAEAFARGAKQHDDMTVVVGRVL